MATIEEIRQELNKAEVRLDEATKKLEKWEDGKYQGVKLNELEDELMKGNLSEKQEKNVKERRDRLLEEKKLLEESKERWEKQVEEWGKRLREFGGGEGNEQIAKKIIFRSFHFVYFSFIQFRLFIYSFALSTTY